eukprot:6476668-Alexandrium_andersonii.AAC.1
MATGSLAGTPAMFPVAMVGAVGFCACVRAASARRVCGGGELAGAGGPDLYARIRSPERFFRTST